MMIREQTVCFTGHRPEKFPRQGNNNDNLITMIKSMLHYRIYAAIRSGYNYFISGLARGVDLWAAESVIDLKREFPHIKLICARPFPEHGNNFKGKDLWSLNNIIEKADNIICVSDRYSPDCYKIRNMYMVDNASYLIGVIDNYRSGTGQTIAYAKKQGLELSIINVPDVVKAADYNEKNPQFFFD